MRRLNGMRGRVAMTASVSSRFIVSWYARLIAMRVGDPNGYDRAVVSLPKISAAWPLLSSGRYLRSLCGTAEDHTAPEIAAPTAPPISMEVRNIAVAAATSWWLADAWTPSWTGTLIRPPPMPTMICVPRTWKCEAPSPRHRSIRARPVM